MSSPAPLAILAGGGALPGRLAAARRASGGQVLVVAFSGITDPAGIADHEHVWLKLGQIQAMHDAIHRFGAREVVMAGPVRRPALSSLALDLRASGMLLRAGRRAFGDDGLLSVIVEELERDGLTVIGLDEVMAGVLAPSGHMAGPEPGPEGSADIRRGLEVLRLLGAADVGQCVAVQHGIVLALEAIEGTDAMIARTGPLRRPGRGPVLVKASKPGQERRVDLPTVGFRTLEAVAAAGFSGIAVEAGGTVLLDREKVIAAATAADLFLVGVDPVR